MEAKTRQPGVNHGRWEALRYGGRLLRITRPARGPTAGTLSLFGVGILFFTFHYMVLRGFYSLEQNRAVIFVQCGVAATNIVAAVALVGATSAVHTSPALVCAGSAQ